MTFNEEINKQFILPLLSNITEQQFKNFLDVSSKLNFNMIEFAIRQENSFEIFKKMIQYIEQKKLTIKLGVGSILNKSDTNKYLNEGAKFIVSPHTDFNIAEACKNKNIPWIPGAATPTEIMNAYNGGAACVKVFPVSSFKGINYIKSILGPFPLIPLMPTGGIQFNNATIKNWKKLNVTAIGLGSNFISKTALNSIPQIENIIKTCISYIN